ncbi:MAG: nicotinate-nucleotide adenylyltransferase [Candidatus Obscuribacterales bacterium]|nr:nicotinate-nucleotide adenylyltransferase [Candidatus Obscuribacterales bacterium]
MKELGIFCGTFNPIHWGHLLLAEFARSQFNLDKVIFVTSPMPPHRHTDLLDADKRHELVIAACTNNPHFEPSQVELTRSGPSYTVDTLRHFKQEFGKEIRLNLLVGQDNLPSLKDWHEASTLFKLCRILVAPRQSSANRLTLAEHLPADADFELIDFPQLPVSSSMIRQRLREHKSVLYLVTNDVNQLLLKHKHYLEGV